MEDSLHEGHHCCCRARLLLTLRRIFSSPLGVGATGQLPRNRTDEVFGEDMLNVTWLELGDSVLGDEEAEADAVSRAREEP